MVLSGRERALIRAALKHAEAEMRKGADASVRLMCETILPPAEARDMADQMAVLYDKMTGG
jgi:hypothetical protein